jgi:hypothetical protein
MKRLAMIFIFSFFLASNPAYSESRDQMIRDAVSGARKWLTLVDKGEYNKSWKEAADYFKSAVREEQWVHQMNAYRKPLGKNISRELIFKQYKSFLPGAPDGHYVVIQFKSSFENKKKAVETVTPMMQENGEWKVSGYYIK